MNVAKIPRDPFGMRLAEVKRRELAQFGLPRCGRSVLGAGPGGVDQEVHLKFVAERFDKLDLGVERVTRRRWRQRCIGEVLWADADDDLAVTVGGQPRPGLRNLCRQRH